MGVPGPTRLIRSLSALLSTSHPPLFFVESRLNIPCLGPFIDGAILCHEPDINKTAELICVEYYEV